jgi:hypothetical protein
VPPVQLGEARPASFGDQLRVRANRWVDRHIHEWRNDPNMYPKADRGLGERGASVAKRMRAGRALRAIDSLLAGVADGEHVAAAVGAPTEGRILGRAAHESRWSTV